MQKQAEWGLPAGSAQYSQALTGTSVTPPPYMRDQAAKADASRESVAAFKEGLRNGVLKGDSVRGLIRGGANGMADTIDYLYDAPTRSAFAPAMLLAKAVTAVTGNPGYENQVIMAAGAFIQGSSIELSADGPIRPPYAVYFQGGLTWQHAKLGILLSLQKLLDAGFAKL